MLKQDIFKFNYTATGISVHFSITLTEVFPRFFLSCKANARV
jgi:hypothetical protein